MNKGLEYSEKLEAYIRNELTETEKAEFEQLLRQDPLLQNELTLQRDIIHSIGEYRKNELKQRLNKIDVRGNNKGTPGDFSVGGAILGGIAIIGIAGLLILKESDKTVNSVQLATSAAEMPIPAKDSKATQLTDTEAFAADTEASGLPLPETQVEADKPIVAAPEAKTTPVRKATGRTGRTTTVSAAPAVIESAPAVVEDEEIRKDDKLAMPETRITALPANADQTLIIVDNNTSAYKLHYKYTNDELFLYGFEKPYKIIDLPQQTQRYLLYEGNFYKLNKNQPQIAPIQRVVNQQEIASLQTYREEKP